MGFYNKEITPKTVNGFRELTIDEINAVSGGFGEVDDNVIIVTGRRQQLVSLADHTGLPDGLTIDIPDHRFGGHGDGGGDQDQDHCPSSSDTEESQDSDNENTANDAAKAVGDIVKGDSGYGPPNALTSPSGRDWTQVEFGAVIIQNEDGSFGILNNNIYNADNPNAVPIQLPAAQATIAVQGFWHNHPSSGGPDETASFYPSDGRGGTINDWNSLQMLKDNIAPDDPNYDPSVWVMGPDVVTRDFKLSERSLYENLSDEQKENGVGLPNEGC